MAVCEELAPNGPWAKHMLDRSFELFDRWTERAQGPPGGELLRRAVDRRQRVLGRARRRARAGQRRPGRDPRARRQALRGAAAAVRLRPRRRPARGDHAGLQHGDRRRQPRRVPVRRRRAGAAVRRPAGRRGRRRRAPAGVLRLVVRNAAGTIVAASQRSYGNDSPLQLLSPKDSQAAVRRRVLDPAGAREDRARAGSTSPPPTRSGRRTSRPRGASTARPARRSRCCSRAGARAPGCGRSRPRASGRRSPVALAGQDRVVPRRERALGLRRRDPQRRARTRPRSREAVAAQSSAPDPGPTLAVRVKGTARDGAGGAGPHRRRGARDRGPAGLAARRERRAAPLPHRDGQGVATGVGSARRGRHGRLDRHRRGRRRLRPGPAWRPASARRRTGVGTGVSTGVGAWRRRRLRSGRAQALRRRRVGAGRTPPRARFSSAFRRAFEPGGESMNCAPARRTPRARPSVGLPLRKWRTISAVLPAVVVRGPGPARGRAARRAAWPRRRRPLGGVADARRVAAGVPTAATGRGRDGRGRAGVLAAPARGRLRAAATSSGVTIATSAAASSGAWCLTTGTVTAPPPTTSAQHAPTATFWTRDAAAAQQLGDAPPTGSSAASRRRREGRVAQSRLVGAALARTSRGAGGRSRSRARRRTPRPPARRAPTTQAVSRACGGLAQVRAGAGEQRAGRVDGRVQPDGDLLVREPVQGAHHQHRLLAVGQAVDVAEQRARLGRGRPARRGAAPLTRRERLELHVADDRRARGRGAARPGRRCGRAGAARRAASIGTTPPRRAASARR